MLSNDNKEKILSIVYKLHNTQVTRLLTKNLIINWISLHSKMKLYFAIQLNTSAVKSLGISGSMFGISIS